MSPRKRRPPVERCASCNGTEFVDAVDNAGAAYRGCARCVVSLPPAAARGVSGNAPRCARHEVGLVNEAFFVCGCRYYPPTVAVPPGLFSLRKLVTTQRRVDRVAEGGPDTHTFSRDQLAIMSYALGVLSAERLARGERLTVEDDAAALDLGERDGGPASPAYRRCVECRDEPHHWLTSMPDFPLGHDPCIPCKHCSATADVCSRCAEGPVWPPHDDGLCRDCRDSLVDRLDEALCSLLHRGDEPGVHDPEAHLALARARSVDPPGDDPIALWREWCSRDITATDDGWAAFTNRVHEMLERRGIKP